MELLYIWIKQYKGLKEVGLTLSNQFRFHYDEKRQIMKVNAAEKYIPDFFGENITNFAGIIGENGTGKTSILRYIMQYFTDGNNDIDENGIVLFYHNQRFYYYSKQKLTFTGSLISSMFENIDDFRVFKDLTMLVFVSTHFDPTSQFSFDYTKEELGDTKNLSTNVLLLKDAQKRKTFIDAEQENVSFREHINAFSAQEFIRIVRLLRWINNKNERRNPFPAQLPPYINLSLYYNEGSPNKDRQIQLRNKLSDYFQIKRSKRNQFLLNAFEAGIFHLMDEGSFSNGSKSKMYKDIDKTIITYIGSNKKQSPELIDEISKMFQVLRVTEKLMGLAEKMKGIEDFILQLADYLDTKDGRINANETGFSVAITKATIASLVELLEKFYAVEKIGDYAEFYFSHQPLGESSLSSGEYSLLTLFGRLNSININKASKKSLLLLIDEAELALHPEWQKRFIDLLTEFVVERFPKCSIQILLTSHSPFILSDLPPNCVVLLKKTDSKSIVIDSLDKKNETFGANIHELFTDSFFLQNGLIGEFARKKIENLVERINNKDNYTIEEYNSLKKEVDIIGEPYVRFKLLEKILKGLPREQFDSVVTEREKELDLIRNIRNDKNRN